MLIVGAKGFAKEVLEVVHQLNQLDHLVFYDDVNDDTPENLFGQFPVLKTLEAASDYFKRTDNRFTIGIGNPVLRKKMYDVFSALGGDFVSIISPDVQIGSYDVEISLGSTILPGVIFSNSVKLGKGCLIYYNSIVTHDCVVGDFVEISPSVTVLGRCEIGSYTQLGANCTVLPDIKIGKNVIVGAGTVVTKNIPDNCVVVGVPGEIIKELAPLDF
ncbi:acetyltransferase [Flavobacterium maritimum]|uniref:acetyltransferase n=1 Tax=Flavobacterium maritimum TaxID=3149042 RepID=UPI0032B3CD40